MMKKICIIPILLGAIAPFIPNALSADSISRRRIALFDVRPDGCETSLSRFATDRLSEKIYATNRFTLVERSQMELILKEQGFQQSGCTELECAVKVGRLLSVDKIVLGSLSCVDGFGLSARVVDVESGVVDGHFSAVTREKKGLDAAAGDLARKLVERYYGGGPSSAGYYLRGAVPGWSQAYAGHEMKGYALMGAFVASGVFMGYALYDFNKRRDEYEDLGSDTPQSTFDDKYDASERALTTARVAIGLFAAVYAVHMLDMLLFSRPSVMYGARPGMTDPGGGVRLAGAFQLTDCPGSAGERLVYARVEKNF